MHSETSRARDYLCRTYDLNNLDPILDIGSGGDPIVKHAISLELQNPYCPLFHPSNPIHIKQDCRKIPQFTDQSCHVVFSSHLIEDFDAIEQIEIIKEWSRLVKIGGLLILLFPEHDRWENAITKLGQPPNKNHKCEPFVGDLTKIIGQTPGDWLVLEDRLLEPDTTYYGGVFVATRTA